MAVFAGYSAQLPSNSKSVQSFEYIKSGFSLIIQESINHVSAEGERGQESCSSRKF